MVPIEGIFPLLLVLLTTLFACSVTLDHVGEWGRSSTVERGRRGERA